MSSFKSTDIPYSRLCQEPDEDHEFINLEELNPCHLNELEVLNQPSPYDIQNHSLIHGLQTVTGNLVSQNSAQKDYGQHCNQIMYQTIPQQTQYEHQLQPSDETIINQPYSSLNQGLYHYSRNYDQNTDPQLHLYHTQMYPQQQMQNQLYYHINSLNNFNENLNSESTYCTVLGNGTSYSVPTSNEAPPSETHSTHSAVQSTTLTNTYVSNSRKRKAYSTTDVSDYESDTEDDAKLAKASQNKKNHSEIEKRRRNKMNNYITELSTLVPMCHSMSRKLDKLTVLRMAVQHMKTVRGSVHSYTEGLYKPTFLSDHELKMLILKAADGFMFVVGCDRGKILYMSESVSQVLNYSQQDLLGQSWFDIIHPEDVAKIKEQLSSTDLSPREKLIDSRTMLPLKTDVLQDLSLLCPGARRSFFCRMKCKSSATSKDNVTMFTRDIQRCKKQTNSDKKYIVIHCTGHLKTWTQSKIGLKERESYGDGYSCNLSCLVAAGRAPPNVLQNDTLPTSSTSQQKEVLKNLQFLSRHTIDGKFLFVDQRATLVLGFLPQELLGTSMYEYYRYEDIPALAEAHKTTLQSTEKVVTSVYRFRTKRNDFVCLRSVWKTFKNPWTKEIESMMAKNSVLFDVIPENISGSTVMSSETNLSNAATNQIPGNFNFSNQSWYTTNGREMHWVINTHVEAIKIGRQIAEQALDSHRKVEESVETSSDTETRIPSTINPFPVASTLFKYNEYPTNELSSSTSVPTRINGMKSRINGSTALSNTSPNEIGMMSNSTLSDTSNSHQMGNSEGNDEAAMALIMSLLEADAGLGGPVGKIFSFFNDDLRCLHVNFLRCLHVIYIYFLRLHGITLAFAVIGT
ncbi:aryl hydrocarbon receptor nuclear translocator-like protein 1 isoform X3 [Contarinia nasturtii]|uniref:aryl hydrocarbon receptor nuclear translocator-like protein 1 isoform X3 n=1 Tax=Contarinia nasturtii TaxID=265458 RepID=UPI0012D41CE1|nr:aryl hydrocarbon receptor nuclear translocator-like protein 1 isoform X3 [Contarinia nasturtii]